MIVYRISSIQYANDLSGTGAGLYGGRWNPPGINMLYTAGSISLACLEYLAHNYHLMHSKSICLIKIEVNRTDSIEEITVEQLPGDWKEKSYEPYSTQQIGLNFFEQNKAHLLKVPSVIVPDEFNYLLNPLHPNHASLNITAQIVPFELDARLFGK